MKILNFGSRILNSGKRGVCTLLLLFAVSATAYAYPPAPYHTIYGLVRDEWGNPLQVESRIILTTADGTALSTRIVPGLAPGINYRLAVPMDAGIAPDLYRPTAQRPFVPFQIEVKIGSQTWLPIEMQGDFRNLGEPAMETRIDLTLGVDSNGDGLPDAWKDMVIAMAGGGLTREDIHPDGDLDGDGMSNYQEYLAGTYAWDFGDRLRLDVIEVKESAAILEFLAIDGRTYRIFGSRNLQDWEPIRFRVPLSDEPDLYRGSYFAPEVRMIRAEVALEPEENPTRFYSLEVQ